ncbi:MAG: N-acetylglucosamine-6-phosphate deacetylase [Verrucomicrobiales bacterium]|nr:N-acetylglucosamine-6-phosphate deacetylase [Verrucomicrobiales bacterium]
MAYFDLQVNGYAGVDFCSDSLCLEDCRRACEALRADGIGGFLATLITDSVSSLEAKLGRLVRFREEDDLVSEMIHGFHVEGPFISPVEGYVGAHPAKEVVPATIEEARRLVEAGRGMIKLVTLAPECDEKAATTSFLTAMGVTVSAGHCNPDLDTLERSIDAGLSMVTHLGNGCPVHLPRHDNFIQRALSLSDRLWLCFIPDGAHVPWFVLENYFNLIGLDRAIVTTDAIAAAGLGAGTYELSGAPVIVDEKGVARRPGSSNLAGSTVRGFEVADHLERELGFSAEELKRVFFENPKKALGI